MNCEGCAYYSWDEEFEEYVCGASMDEDDMVRIVANGYRSCPYYRDGDEYRIARKQ
ncbi:MAG: hypothetical protein IIZ39_12115 [Blautia sp.]|nr:hypothetical protein [Blautia sp.]